MTKMSVAPSLKTKINADDVMVSTGVKQGKKLPAFFNEKIKDVYSTNEVKTNKVGPNDKPIYRKVIKSQFKKGENVSHNISNVKDIWINQGESYTISPDDNEIFPTSYYFSGTDWLRIHLKKQEGQIAYRGDDNKTAWNVVLCLEYTKTTD